MGNGITPGAWHLTPGERKNLLDEWTVFHGDGCLVSNQVCSAKSLADARLIVAAPLLLQAIEAGKAYADALANYSEHAGKIIDGVKSLDDLFEDWQEKQNAALEAAKGGA